MVISTFTVVSDLRNCNTLVAMLLLLKTKPILRNCWAKRR